MIVQYSDLGDHLWKDMRTTFATQLTDQDVPEPVIAALLGHSHRSKVTRRYAKAQWMPSVACGFLRFPG